MRKWGMFQCIVRKNNLRTVVEGDSIVQQAVLSHYTSQDVTLTLTQNGIAAPEDFIVDISGLALNCQQKLIKLNITFTARDIALVVVSQ